MSDTDSILVAQPPMAYVIGSEGGSKEHLLLDALRSMEFGQSPADTPPCSLSRRDFMKSAAAATAAVSLMSVRPSKARAEFFTFFVAAVLTAGIGWLVKRILDKAFPIEEADITRVRNPRPTKDKFHNQFTEPYIIANRRLFIETAPLPEYGGVDFGIDGYLRLNDLNGLELEQMRREEKYNESALVPRALRRPLQNIKVDRDELKATAHLYKIDVDPMDVHYVQEFTDRKGKSHVGFAVKNGGKAHLLLK